MTSSMVAPLFSNIQSSGSLVLHQRLSVCSKQYVSTMTVERKISIDCWRVPKGRTPTLTYVTTLSSQPVNDRTDVDVTSFPINSLLSRHTKSCNNGNTPSCANLTNSSLQHVDQISVLVFSDDLKDLATFNGTGHRGIYVEEDRGRT